MVTAEMWLITEQERTCWGRQQKETRARPNTAKNTWKEKEEGSWTRTGISGKST